MALVVKDPPANAGDVRELGLISGWRRSPGGGQGNPFLPGESHGQKSLVGCSPWGHTKSDTTKQLSTHALLLALGLFL